MSDSDWRSLVDLARLADWMSSQGLESGQIELLGGEANGVAGRARLDPRGRAEYLPQVGDLPLHLLQGRHWSSSRIQIVGEPIDRDDAVGAQEQDCEGRTLLGAPELDLTALTDDLQRPQDAELEHSAGPYSFDTAWGPAASTIAALRRPKGES